MKRAFTLIELMIVVAIIGILASIAVPNFVKFQCRAKQSEAKTGLKNIVVAEELHRGNFDTYEDGNEADLSIIGFAITGTTRRYEFSVPDGATTTTFSALAAAHPDGVGADGITYRGGDLIDGAGNPDTWSADQTGVRFEADNEVCR